MEYTGAQLQYLDHLGIDVWVPREQLHAPVIPSQVETQLGQQQAPVNDAPFSEDMEHPRAGVTPQVQQVPQTSTQPVQRSENYQVPPATIHAPQPTATDALTVTPQQKMNDTFNVPVYPGASLNSSSDKTNGNKVEDSVIEKAPHFNIQFWCYSTGLWVVSGNVNLQPEEHKLVHNIAQFIQGKKRKPKHVGIFSWPMLDSPNIDQGPDVAIKHLKDHVHRLQEISAVTKIVAFSDCESWFDHLSPVKVSMALNEVIGNAENKKSLWQQLIPHQLSD